MIKVAALLVDLDGTLMDTAAANHAAYAAALAEFDVSISRADFEHVAQGRHWRQFLPELLLNAGVACDPAQIARRKAELYPSMMGQVFLNSALVRILETRKADCRLALVTTASASNVQSLLSHFGLTTLFDTVVTGNDVARHKPDPEAYCLAAARLGVSAAECIVIEDSEIGAAAGEAFGSAVLRIRMSAKPESPQHAGSITARGKR